MRKVLRLALNDLHLTARDRPAFIWMIVMPIAFMWFFGMMFQGGGGGTPQIELGVLDHDGGWVARALVEDLKDESVNLMELEPGWCPGIPDAPDPVRWVVVPEGFTEKVLAGEQQALRLERKENASQEYSLAAQVHLVRAIARLLSRLVELEAGEDMEKDAPPPGEIPERYQVLAARSPQVTLAVSTAGEGQAVPSGMYQSVPGILVMMVLMMTVIYGGAFLTMERQGGTLRRQATLPVSRGQIILGKLAGRFLLAALQILILVLAGRFLFGVSWGNSWGGLILVLACYAAAVSGLAILLGAALRTPEQAGSIGWILSMALAALGGCWWPAEVMPGWMRTASLALPTSWAMDAFHTLISFGRGIESVWLPSVVLLGFAAVFSLLGARFLRFD